MTDIVLLHSALGLNEGVLAWAERLRAEGHQVTTPDFYDGDVFDNVDDGVAKADAAGMNEWVKRASSEMGEPSAGTVYAGFSLGAGIAQILAFDDPAAGGLILMHGAIAPHWLDTAAWPVGLRAQLHFTEADPWVEAPDVTELAAFATPGALDTYVYPGDKHLFAFEHFGDYDAGAADLMFGRTVAFLEARER